MVGNICTCTTESPIAPFSQLQPSSSFSASGTYREIHILDGKHNASGLNDTTSIKVSKHWLGAEHDRKLSNKSGEFAGKSDPIYPVLQLAKFSCFRSFIPTASNYVHLFSVSVIILLSVTIWVTHFRKCFFQGNHILEMSCDS